MTPMNCLLDVAYHVGTAGNYSSVPAPTKANPNVPWMYDYLSYHMETYANVGITDLVLPPPGKAQGGSGKGCDGYGAFNPFYDLGLTKDQGSVETRFGPFSSLLRMIARAHRFGLRVHFSVVLHQRDGGNNKVYEFLGADGKTKNGRWPLTPDCFTPPRPSEPIMGPQSDNYAFGDPCAYVNALPVGYMIDGAVNAIDWLTTTLDADGFWIDDPKGLSQEIVSAVLNRKSMASKWAFCEYYDGNPNTLSWFVWNQMKGRVSAMDFTLRWHAQAAANNASRYDMRQILTGGFNLMSPQNAVTFVEDHDTDLSFPCIWNKALAYEIIMMMPGLPMPFGRDYFVRADCYGLAPIINNQIWRRTFLAQGEFVPRYSSYQIIAWERMGYGDAPGCLTVINNEMGSHSNPADWKPVTVQTHWPNTRLHDYSTNGASDQQTDGNGQVTVWVPPNDSGMGFVCYAPAGINRPIQVAPALTTTHRIEGAADLGIDPAIAGARTEVVELWCEANHPITIKQLHGDSDLEFLIAGTTKNAAGQFVPLTTGRYYVTVFNPGTADSHYVVNITYLGGSTMPSSELTPAGFAINAEPSENDLGRKQHRISKLTATLPESLS